MDAVWIEQFAASPVLLPVLLLLVIGDAFFVILPSETAVVALGSLAASTGSPNAAAVVAVAAVGALLGDSACFAIGRRVGLDRWRWQREGAVARALVRLQATVRSRPAILIFTARYIPFARIAVNLSAGASGLSYRRFLPLSAAASLGWALYNTGIGAFFGSLLSATPLLALAVAVVVAIVLGVAVDTIAQWVARRRQKK